MEFLIEECGRLQGMIYYPTGSIVVSVAAIAFICFVIILLCEKMTSENKLILIVLKIILGVVVTDSFGTLPEDVDTIVFFTNLNIPVTDLLTSGEFPYGMIIMALLMVISQCILDFSLEENRSKYVIALNLLHIIVIIYESIFHPCGFILFYMILVCCEIVHFTIHKYNQKELLKRRDN